MTPESSEILRALLLKFQNDLVVLQNNLASKLTTSCALLEANQAHLNQLEKRITAVESAFQHLPSDQQLQELSRLRATVVANTEAMNLYLGELENARRESSQLRGEYESLRVLLGARL